MTEDDGKALEELASMFKALANPTRLKILAICSLREASSRELREALGISKPLLIAHIRILLRAGLLTYRVEVDEAKGVVRKYYRTTDFHICMDRKHISRFYRRNEAGGT